MKENKEINEINPKEDILNDTEATDKNSNDSNRVSSEGKIETEKNQENVQQEILKISDTYLKTILERIEILEKEAINNKEIKSKQDEKLSKQEEKLSKQYEKLSKQDEKLSKQEEKISSLERDNKMLKADNKILKADKEKNKEKLLNLENKISNLENRIYDLEALLVRNNINLDVLANRDTLKTFVFLFAVNIDEDNIKLIKEDKNNNKFEIKKKFTELVKNVLKKLKQKLEACDLIRSGFNPDDNISKKDKCINDIKFIECIHYIVCCIDNIVHPPADPQDDNKIKLIGNRSINKLKEGLKLFFKDPEKMNDVKKMINEKENSSIFGGDKDITFENYQKPKNFAYLKNKTYYLKLGENNYEKEFYIQYLFSDLKSDNINNVKMNMKYEEFIEKLNDVIKSFNEKQFTYKADELLSNFKW